MGTVFVLVGPKGAGKTHIGVVVERHTGVRFLRVEPVFLEAIRELGRERGEPEGFLRVAAELERLPGDGEVVIEATGASDHFPPFLAGVRRIHEVRLLAVRAPLDVCAHRVRTRDTTHHIPVSDHMVQQVNERAITVQLPWDGELDNAVGAAEDDIVRWFRAVRGR